MWQHTGQKRPDLAVDPSEGQESVWDYPRPPSLVADSRRVLVKSGRDVIADTVHSYRLCETASPPTFYLRPDDVNWDLLISARGSSICEWKGEARYWAMADNPDVAVGWSYSRPRPRYDELKNHVAFYPALVDCHVDGERVTPQPGRFYGGWITSDVVGPYKGDPGTGHW
jgi:uncharacterized protein (DUF427 family)